MIADDGKKRGGPSAVFGSLYLKGPKKEEDLRRDKKGEEEKRREKRDNR